MTYKIIITWQEKVKNTNINLHTTVYCQEEQLDLILKLYCKPEVEEILVGKYEYGE